MTMFLFGRNKPRMMLGDFAKRGFRASQVMNNKDYYKTLGVSRGST